MPQMAPMSWTILMISFITLILMFSSYNYWTFMPTPNQEKTNNQKLTTNWKW